jgi:hypothetical protein
MCPILIAEVSLTLCPRSGSSKDTPIPLVPWRLPHAIKISFFACPLWEPSLEQQRQLR